MKLSKLVYECVKDSITIPNDYLNYTAFCNGEYKNDNDYKFQVASVFNYINLAIARLSDSKKISYQLVDQEIESQRFKFDKGQIINIVRIVKSAYTRFEFRSFNNGKEYQLLLDSNFPIKVSIEYEPKIPHFTDDDIKQISIASDGTTFIDDSNIELEDLGISDKACEYIKAWVAAQILEVIAPEVANNHNNRAEQYFELLEIGKTSFSQNKIYNKLGDLF